MRISTFIFRIVTSWFSILLGNLAILFLVGLAMYASSLTPTTDILPDLQSDTLTTIIIAWGIILESRESFLSGGLAARKLTKHIDDFISYECACCGTVLVILGMLIELATYFDVDSRMTLFPAWADVVVLVGEWAMLVLVCIEVAYSCFNIVRVRLKGEDYAAQAMQSVSH